MREREREAVPIFGGPQRPRAFPHCTSTRSAWQGVRGTGGPEAVFFTSQHLSSRPEIAVATGALGPGHAPPEPEDSSLRLSANTNQAPLKRPRNEVFQGGKRGARLGVDGGKGLGVVLGAMELSEDEAFFLPHIQKPTSHSPWAFP